jgi:Family of unknown function (DUF5694)
MKLFILTIHFILITQFIFGQNKISKTKILLIGTIHFETVHKDKFELKTDDFLAPKRQKELVALIEKLSATKATTVMIERLAQDQVEIDSIYNSFLKGLYNLSVSEREQIGFRLAKKLKLKHINCIDAEFGNPHDSMMRASAITYNQMQIIDSLGVEANLLINEFANQLNKGTITTTLKYINQPKLLKQNLGLYLKYVAKIGAGKNFSGAESVSDWYLRNLGIYSNILNQVKPKDNYIILIFGQGHVPILRHFFENNTDFEIVELESILK